MRPWPDDAAEVAAGAGEASVCAAKTYRRPGVCCSAVPAAVVQAVVRTSRYHRVVVARVVEAVLDDAKSLLAAAGRHVALPGDEPDLSTGISAVGIGIAHKTDPATSRFSSTESFADGIKPD